MANIAWIKRLAVLICAITARVSGSCSSYHQQQVDELVTVEVCYDDDDCSGFYPYDEWNGDARLYDNDDGFSDRQYTSIPVKLFGNTYTSLYVS